MSVVGFDFGNANSYIAVARQGGIEVITNEYSLHATPSCVAFGTRSRLMGYAAKQQQNTNTLNTVNSFKQLLGRKYSDPLTKHFLSLVHNDVIQIPDDELAIRLVCNGEKVAFLPEQLTAMLLVKLKGITETNVPDIKNVTDCVVTVPAFFTDQQRRALLDAIDIAGLKCLRIFNESTAVALAYGIYKQDLPVEPEKPKHVVFVDIGHSCCQATLVAFNKGKLAGDFGQKMTSMEKLFASYPCIILLRSEQKSGLAFEKRVVGYTYNFQVAGCRFDDILRHHFRDVFMNTYKIDAMTSKRAWVRLLDECEKLKKQMSANSTPIPINIECFMEDKDVTSKMQRSDFEELCQPIFRSFEEMLRSLMEKSKMRISDVDAIEIVGGSSRIPALKSVITKVFGKDPMTTMNQDEAVARGAAMQCAILSPTFKVRDFAVKDCQPFQIRLEWQPTKFADGGFCDVFNERDEFPFSKMLTFYRTEPFELKAHYPSSLPYADREIGYWTIKGITPTANNESRKVKVKARVNPHGLFSISSAITYETVEVKTEEVADSKGTTSEAKTEEKAAGAADDDESSKMEVEHVGNDGDKTKPKTKLVSVDLPIDQVVRSLNNLEFLKQAERELQKVDRHEKEKADAKNGVEEYVYYMREKLEDSYREFITPQDAEKFKTLLNAMEEWLYDEGEDTDIDVYTKKLNQMKQFGDPVMERFKEFDSRKAAFDVFDKSIIRTRKAYEDYTRGGEKYSHLDSKDMEKVISAIEEKKAWVDQKRSHQDRRPKTESPSIFTHEITSEQQKFENIVLPILNKPKPAPKAPEQKVPEGGKQESTETPTKDANAKQGTVDESKPTDMEVD